MVAPLLLQDGLHGGGEGKGTAGGSIPAGRKSSCEAPSDGSVRVPVPVAWKGAGAPGRSLRRGAALLRVCCWSGPTRCLAPRHAHAVMERGRLPASWCISPDMISAELGERMLCKKERILTIWKRYSIDFGEFMKILKGSMWGNYSDKLVNACKYFYFLFLVH